MVRHSSFSAARPRGRQSDPLPTCFGRGCAGVGPRTGPLARVPCGVSRAAGVAGGCPRGGIFHHCEQRLVSGALPPPAARHWGDDRALLPVFSLRWWCGRGDPSPALQRALLRGGVGRSGCGRRASLG